MTYIPYERTMTSTSSRCWVVKGKIAFSSITCLWDKWQTFHNCHLRLRLFGILGVGGITVLQSTEQSLKKGTNVRIISTKMTQKKERRWTLIWRFCISYAADLIPLEDLFGTHSVSQSFTHFNHPESIRMNGITVTDPDRVLCHRTHTYVIKSDI